MENKKIIDYIILSDSYHGNLEMEVKEKINEGYLPLGGVSYSYHYVSTYAQAMVKYEE